ncbi:MAG: nucleoside 2-deoxyribosyltransferase [Proteobacteria bacterium]|nr:nucleoside 2-deoxyribosyltransferase [Pseudomonadota bacterium]MBU1639982.1 nucleoside 2-deoxyribosyltransferase [Pseudomonadota bacterium]
MTTATKHSRPAIYFAGAIRGGRDDAKIYASLIDFLQGFGQVLTSHVGDETLLAEEKFLSEGEIFQRDMKWLAQADLVIAEVTTPSLGVGYELALAEKRGIPCFCLFRRTSGVSLSAMIAGNPSFTILPYLDQVEAEQQLVRIMAGFADITIP